MKAVIRLFMAAVTFFAAVATFNYLADNMPKEKKYIVINSDTNEIY